MNPAPSARSHESHRQHAGRRAIASFRIHLCQTAAMPTDHRSARRGAMINFRITPEEKARLKSEAAEAGLTLTQLFELRMLGYTTPVGKSGPQPQSERLDISA